MVVSLHTGLTSRPDEIYCLQFPHITLDPYKFAESVQELGLKAEGGRGDRSVRTVFSCQCVKEALLADVAAEWYNGKVMKRQGS